MRYFIHLSYFGKSFHGWQVQPNAVSVQEVLNTQLSLLCGEKVYAVGAGRTDTGVHAKQMYAHFDTEKRWDENLTYRLNKMVGPDVAIKEVVEVSAEAHTRFDAIYREYEYKVVQYKDPFLQDLVWYVPYDLDFTLMNKAAEFLLGKRDFGAFSRSNTQVKTNICKVQRAEWQQLSGHWVFYIGSDRFLRNMVRAIVGTLVQVGCGKLDVNNIKEILESKDRSKAGESAPAHGLYLTKVIYPKEILAHG